MLVSLDKFKKQNIPCFVAWNSGKVTANDKTYKLQFISVGGTKYPYVNVPTSNSIVECEYESGTKRRSEFPASENDKIRIINLHKETLKNREYNFDGIRYYVTGIGYDSIKVEKNGVSKYYWYYTLEGKYLLNRLFNIVESLIL